ncbi:MAG TPA: hypothetical protein VMI75_00725 [Polyangiaceae bacterium]|nr:hypothetical protein [Polyangiaceae bacterium]
MQIDAGSFFILAFTLAAGGVGGYYASEKHLFRPPPPPPAAPPPPAPTVSAATSAPPPPPPKPAPTCDDMVGSPGACPPPVWPAEEGMPGCGTLPTKRCEDFKQAMKPRVAERAVACLNALNQAQRCDPNRLELCGHTALMSACSIVEPLGPDGAGAPSDSGTDEIATHCASILHECEGVSSGPTMHDCRTTLAGMSVLGRDRMVACMKTHCTDKGLLFCEAQIDVK